MLMKPGLMDCGWGVACMRPRQKPIKVTEC